MEMRQELQYFNVDPRNKKLSESVVKSQSVILYDK